MILPEFGEKFTGQAYITLHAQDEAVKKFGVRPKHAEEWVRSKLSKARFISDILSEDGNLCRLYATERISIVLDMRENKVVTVYPRHRAPESLRQRIESMIAKELRKLKRHETALERKYRLPKAELEVEKAELNLRLLKTKSEAVKLACQARINAIDQRIAEMDEEIENARIKRSTFAKGVAMYV